MYSKLSTIYILHIIIVILAITTKCTNATKCGSFYCVGNNTECDYNKVLQRMECYCLEGYEKITDNENIHCEKKKVEQTIVVNGNETINQQPIVDSQGNLPASEMRAQIKEDSVDYSNETITDESTGIFTITKSSVKNSVETTANEIKTTETTTVTSTDILSTTESSVDYFEETTTNEIFTTETTTDASSDIFSTTEDYSEEITINEIEITETTTDASLDIFSTTESSKDYSVETTTNEIETTETTAEPSTTTNLITDIETTTSELETSAQTSTTTKNEAILGLFDFPDDIDEYIYKCDKDEFECSHKCCKVQLEICNEFGECVPEPNKDVGKAEANIKAATLFYTIMGIACIVAALVFSIFKIRKFKRTGVF